MKIKSEHIAKAYIALVMFLPNSMYLVNKPGMPLISYRRCFIFVWIFFYALLIIKKNSIRNQIFDMPYCRGAIFLSAILGLISVCTLISNPQSILNFISIITESIFPTFMIWSAFKTKDRLLYAIKAMIQVYSLIAIYGIVSYIYNYNPLLELMSSDNSERILILTYDDRERGGVVGRAQAFFFHPIQFGYISSAILVFILGVHKEVKLFSVMKFLFICLILILATMYASSRSPILFLMVAAFVHILCMNIRNMLKMLAFFAIALPILAYSDLLSVVFGDRLQLIASIFENMVQSTSRLEDSSSIELRLIQMAVAMDFFWESPIYGHGLAYLRILMENGMPADLFGAESFLFALLIEMGTLGIIGYYALYKGIYSSFIMHIKFSKLKTIRNMAVTGIALLAGHIAFIFATGEMGSTYIYLVLTTLLLRLIQLTQSENKSATRL